MEQFNKTFTVDQTKFCITQIKGLPSNWEIHNLVVGLRSCQLLSQAIVLIILFSLQERIQNFF